MSTMTSIEKIQPQNLEAEQSLLGAILIDKDAIIRIGDTISPEDFYHDNHRLIYEAILELFRRREPIDLLSLGNHLTEKGILEQIGGRAYLITLTNTVPTAAHVTNYAQIVQKKATLRRLIRASQEILGLGYEETEDIENTLDTAEQKLFNVSQKFLKQSFIPISSALEEAFERIDELSRERGKLRGISTGFTDIDKLLGGLQKSDLVVLAARPSVGKTSLALDMARHAASHSKMPVGIFSLEMSKEQLVDRLICAEAGVDLWRLRTGRLSDQGEHHEFERIAHALGTLSETPIYIDDSASANIMEIRTKARRLQMERGLGLLIIDYLQLMESRTRTDNRVQEVAEITRSLKGIARELAIPVLALSQLSRAVEARSPAIPKLADLRESGSIEQDADVVMFIYRKSMDRGLSEVPAHEKNLTEIHIAKHRNGPTGVINLYFDEPRACFRNIEKNAPPSN